MKKFDLDENIACECYKALIMALGQKDEHTQLHSERVVELSEEIGLALGLDESQIKILRISAAFHDVGKIGIPDKILLKPTAFEDDEWEIMKTHSVNSEELVKNMYFDNGDIIAKAVRNHHEHYDGNGYPDKLKGKDIPIYSRIISFADSYDAMATPRPYHKQRPHDEIMEIIESETGKKHDPELFKIFKKIIKTSPYRVS